MCLAIPGQVVELVPEQPALVRPDNPTIRKKVETALKQSGGEQTQELALDDPGLDGAGLDVAVPAGVEPGSVEPSPSGDAGS